MSSMSLENISLETLQSTIKEFETLGRDPFLKKYGYSRSWVYFLKNNEQIYDLKPILGVARVKEFPNSDLLNFDDFIHELPIMKKKFATIGYDILHIKKEPKKNTQVNRFETEKFMGFTQDSFDFLRDLKSNNNLKWISANWKRYEILRGKIKHLTIELGDRYIAQKYPFLETIANSTHCLSRINKQFVKENNAYNTHLWAAFYRKTQKKKTDDVQYYFTIHDNYFASGLVFGKNTDRLKNRFRAAVRKDRTNFLGLVKELSKDLKFILNRSINPEDIRQGTQVTNENELESWLRLPDLEISHVYSIDNPILMTSSLVDSIIEDFKALDPIYQYILSVCGESGEPDDDYEPQIEAITEQVINLPQFIESLDIVNQSKFSGHLMEDPVRIKLLYLMEYCNNTSWVLPRFQRYFDWQQQDIQSFLKSVFNDYYVGSLLLWKAGGEPEVETQSIKGVDAKDKLRSDLVILDGQQRITSLYYAIAAPMNKSFQDKAFWKDTRIYKDHPMYFYIDFNNYLKDPQTSEVIKVKNIKLGREESFQRVWFPFYELDKYDDWLFEFQNHLREQCNSELVYNSVTDKKIRDMGEIIRKRLSHMWTAYEIPYIILPKSMGINQVTDIFEQLNTKGKPLNVFDLLVARLYTHKIKLKDLWDVTVRQYPRIFRYSKQVEKIPIYILQSISLYYSDNSSAKRSEILDIYKNIYEKHPEYKFEEQWAEMSGYMEMALEKLEKLRDGYGVKDEKEIPFESMIPVLTALLKLITIQDNKASCFKKIDGWYWSSAFTNAYSQAAEAQMTVDYKELKEWFNDENKIPRSIMQMRDELNRLRLTDVKSKSNSKYKAILSLIALEGAKDFDTTLMLENASRNDKDHLFPIRNYGDSVNINSVLNMTWMSGDTNRYIKKYMNPSIYINKFINEKYGGNKDKFIDVLKSHLINDEAINYLYKDDFDNFIMEREKVILSKLEERLGIARLTSNINMISPETPFSNKKFFWDTLRECNGYIHWVDKYFSQMGLELLSQSQIDSTKINEIKILMSGDRVEGTFRDLFKNFREEYRKKGIDVQLRVILDTQIKNEIHDRWIISLDKVYNVTSPDIVARGQYSEIKRTNNRPPFNEWWIKSKDLITDWNFIKELKENS